jgi:4-aminobutyrate aminotransferase-like enzyme
MDAAWPPSTGEAIHTSTFLGHPVGCAMALAQIGEIRRLGLPRRAARLGRHLGIQLQHAARRTRGLHAACRGIGLMAGIELRRDDGTPGGVEAIRVVQGMLDRGFLLLPEGPSGEVISLTPPLTIPVAALRRATLALGEELASL